MSDLLNQASLVYIPSGYKEDTAYSVIPTDGSGDLTFTRASDGTRVNSSGLVENVPWNLLQQSNTFSTTWTTVNASVTGGQSGYDGSSGAWLLEKSASAGYLRQNNTSSNLQTYSIYAKSGTLNWVVLESVVIGNAYFDLQNGVIGNASASLIDKNIDSVGNGWYRISITYNATISQVRVFPADSNGSVSGTSGNIYIQDAQLNQGSTAKPYFPTTDRQNVPRLTYEGGCPSLLLEPQRTNLALYSEEFDNAYWSKTAGTTITANTTISPDGTQNADTITFAASGDSINRFATTGLSVVSGTTYTFSVFTKSTTQVVRFGGATGGTGTNVYNGAVDYGNGWYRQSVTRTWSASGTVSVQLVLSLNAAGSTILYGFQAELGAYPTSYIPTTSAAVTRVADAAYKTGISSLIGQTEGTAFIEFEITTNDSFDSGFPALIDISDATVNNRFSLFLNDSTYSPARLQLFVSNGGVTQVSITASAPISVGRHKVAFAYKLNDYAIYIDGVLIGTDTSATVPACSKLAFTNFDGSIVAENKTNQAALFKTRLSNTELAALTTL